MLSLHPPCFLKCDPALTRDGSDISSDPALVDQEFQMAGLPYFSRSVRGHADQYDLAGEVGGWLPVLDVIHVGFDGKMLLEAARKRI